MLSEESLAILRKRTKEARRRISWECTRSACRKTEEIGKCSFKRCARCTRPYCPRECQTLDWTEHKPKCKAVNPDRAPLMKAMQHLISHPILFEHLEKMAILQLGLHRYQPESLMSPNFKPFDVDVSLQMEPADLNAFFRLYSPLASIDTTPIQGIPQIINVSVPDEDDPRTTSRCWDDIPIWTPCIGFINFQLKTCVELHLPVNMSICCQLTPSLIERVRNQQEVELKLFEDETFHLPMNTDSYVELINYMIRSDMNNRWSWRATIPDMDKKLTHGAALARTETMDLLIRNLREKVKRECIYLESATQIGLPLDLLFQAPYVPNKWETDGFDRRPFLNA